MPTPSPADAAALCARADEEERALRFAPAEELRWQVVALLDAAAAPAAPSLTAALRALAGNLRRQGKYAAAEPVLRRLIAVEEALHGPDHPALGLLLDQLAAAVSRAHPERTKEVKQLEVRAAHLRAKRRV